jgi:serine protease Do
MKLLKILAVFITVIAVGAVAVVSGQREQRLERRARELTTWSGRGPALGMSVRDIQAAEAGERPGGVLIDEIRAGSPADKAGFKQGDIIVEFDGERVRSARQFARLVQETTPGRTVKATLMRDGRRSDLEITPSGPDDRRGDLTIHGDFGDDLRHLGPDLERLGDGLPPFNFNFDFDVTGVAGRRLGVTVDELTNQLAGYFGASGGVLVTSVAEGSSASRAGLKAGDVITSIDGDPVRSRQDLLRGLRHASDGDELTLGIVRDKKDSTVKAKIESPRRMPRGRPV